MKRFGRMFWLTAYYALASHLPDLGVPGGRLCNRLRCVILRHALPAFGAGNETDSKIYVGDGSDVWIGGGCQINWGSRLTRVRIGDHVMVGPEVLVIGQLHRTESTSHPMVSQGAYTKPVTVIEDDVWVGARAIVMPGVRIGRGSIVGAGAVVTKDVAPFTVVAGVPARFVSQRGMRQEEVS